MRFDFWLKRLLFERTNEAEALSWLLGNPNNCLAPNEFDHEEAVEAVRSLYVAGAEHVKACNIKKYRVWDGKKSRKEKGATSDRVIVFGSPDAKDRLKKAIELREDGR